MTLPDPIWVRDLLLACRWVDLGGLEPLWWPAVGSGLFLSLAGGRWRLVGRRVACGVAGAMAGMSVATEAGWIPEAGAAMVTSGWAGIGAACGMWLELGAPRVGLSLIGWMLGAVLAHVSWVLGSSGWTVTAAAALGAAGTAWTWDVAPRPWSALTGSALLCACVDRSLEGPAVLGLTAVSLGLQWLTAREERRSGTGSVVRPPEAH